MRSWLLRGSRNAVFSVILVFLTTDMFQILIPGFRAPVRYNGKVR